MDVWQCGWHWDDDDDDDSDDGDDNDNGDGNDQDDQFLQGFILKFTILQVYCL
jgi:hypothetical protein